MRYSFEDKSPHTQVNEFHNKGENLPYNERQTHEELYLQNQTHNVQEEQELNGQAKDGENADSSPKNGKASSKRTSKLLSSVALLFAAGTMVIAPAMASAKPPQAFIVQEAVGCLTYDCLLGYEGEQAEFDVILTTAEGAHVQTIDDVNVSSKTQTGVQFASLTPKTEYELTLVNNDGEVAMEYEFTTQPFVRVEVIDQTKTKLIMHEQLLGFVEMGVDLIGENGEDFSSNLVYSENIGEIILYSAGLYAMEYRLTASCFLEGQGVNVYSTPIATGNLDRLIYSANVQNYDQSLDAFHDISLIYQTGDIAPYTPISVEIYNEDYSAYYNFSQEEFAIDGNDIYLSLYEKLESGSYNVCVWGEFVGQETNFYNQIWLGKIQI